MTEQDIQTLESEFPGLSGEAFSAARERVLRSGQSVLEAKDGTIFEVFPDGRRVEIKKIHPPKRVVPGTVYTIR